MRLRSWWALVFVCCLVAGGRPCAGQSGCLKGTVLMALGVNGAVKVCPEYDAKVPELQKRLDAIQQNLSGNRQLLLELTHSARSVNSVARDVDANRQLQLLKSFSVQLQESSTADQKKTQELIAELANRLDELQDLVMAKKEDEKTAQQTRTALNGPLGDAIAGLDFKRAEVQLDSIQAKLESIGGDVKVTRDNTQVIKETLAAREAREKAAADQEANKAKALDEDPNMYTRAQIMPLGIAPLHYMVYFYTRPPLYPPFIDSQFSMAFRKGTNAWRVDATDKEVSGGGELWKINLDEVGDRATICFVAHDRPSGRLKEWMQRYKLTPSATRTGDVNFIPDGDASMRLIDGGPCDGVTQVRKEAAAAMPVAVQSQPSTADANKIQLAKVQELMAQAQERTRQAAPNAVGFARIMAQGSRRDNLDGNQWQIKVDTQPFRPGTTLYDVHVEAVLLDDSGRATPLKLSNRQLFVNIESRYAWVNHLGTKAVVCLTAKDPARNKPYRLTQWFTVESTRVYFNEGGARVPGESATFVPAQPATVEEASDTPCK